MIDLLEREVANNEQAELHSSLKKFIEDTIREYIKPVIGKFDRTNELLLTKLPQIDFLEAKMEEFVRREKEKHSEKNEKSKIEDGLKEKQTKHIFSELAKKWKDETINHSSMQRITSNSSYLSIIGLGPDAIPLILEELESEPDWWFCALRAITRVDPITENMRGNLIAMKNSWLDWGRKNGYV